MTTITAKLAHPERSGFEPYDFSFREFEVLGYADPHDTYCADSVYFATWYLNAAGFAQKYDLDRPPASQPCEYRLMLKPCFLERDA